MKTIKLFAIVMLVFGFFQSNAQSISKEELKEWKNQAKEYKKNPAALKILTEKVEGLESEAAEATSEARRLRQELSTVKIEENQKNAKIATLEDQVRSLNQQLAETRTALMQSEQRTEMTARGGGNLADGQGIVFRIQLGAFEKRQVATEMAVADDGFLLEDENGVQKITIGHFRDFESAKALRDHMVTIGVKGAWVVPYRDGVRITLQEALEGQSPQ